MKLRIHPLFFPFGIYYALTGRIFLFIIVTITAVIHEFGHSFVAGSFGYKLNKITLMPFGAVVSGNTDGLKAVDEIKIALGGPVLNLALGLFFVAVWWIYPESYAFTDTAVYSNFALGIINLIPAYPLDGGRVLSSILKNKIGEKKARTVCKWIGIVISLMLIALFISTVFKEINISILFFALFILFGDLEKGRADAYIKIYSGVDNGKLKRGMSVNRVAVSKDMTVKRLIKCLNENMFNEVIIAGDKVYKILYQDDITKIIEKSNIYDTLEKYI